MCECGGFSSLRDTEGLRLYNGASGTYHRSWRGGIERLIDGAAARVLFADGRNLPVVMFAFWRTRVVRLFFAR